MLLTSNPWKLSQIGPDSSQLSLFSPCVLSFLLLTLGTVLWKLQGCLQGVLIKNQQSKMSPNIFLPVVSCKRCSNGFHPAQGNKTAGVLSMSQAVGMTQLGFSDTDAPRGSGFKYSFMGML